jgi:alanine dehydrogenase
MIHLNLTTSLLMNAIAHPRPTVPTIRRTLVFTASDVRGCLDMPSCIAVVEMAFAQLAEGNAIPPGVLGTHVTGGGFHVKTAGLHGKRSYYAAKINANFPGNPSAHGLPTIQGVVALFDAERGEVLAVMDSIEITGMRTAAASAVAARHLAREDARTVAIIGCGTQALYHARAMAAVRQVGLVRLADRDRSAAERLAQAITRELSVQVEIVDDHRAAARSSDIVVTCTPSREPILGVGDLPPGGFVAAVGADSEMKQEIDPRALAASAVVVDVLDQCATIGDLHHALEARTMTRDDVRANLGEVVIGAARARFRSGETVVFDSTGTALQDVAAAAMIYEQAESVPNVQQVAFAS